MLAEFLNMEGRATSCRAAFVFTGQR